MNKQEKNISVMIVDDEVLFCEGTKLMLQSHNISTLAIAKNGEEALKELAKIKPDIVLLDLEMPILNGNKTLQNIIIKYPAQKVIIISSYHDKELLNYYMNNGAMAYISKNESFEILVMAIKSVANGKSYTENIPALEKNEAIKNRHYYRSIFTAQERKIISLLANGKTTREIANEILISEKSVREHLRIMCKKAKVKNRHELTVLIVKQGLEFIGL